MIFDLFIYCLMYISKKKIFFKLRSGSSMM